MEHIKFNTRTKSDGSAKSLLKNEKIPCVIYGKN